MSTAGMGSDSTGGQAEELCASKANGLTFFRAPWTMAGSFAFPHTDGDGQAFITSLTVGGRAHDDNFANRGDVIIVYDDDADEVTIELRKFAFADHLEQAQDWMDGLSLWAYAAAKPKPPEEMPAEDDCTSGWQDGCQVRVYYPGHLQPSRLGADIRVTLPSSYRQSIALTAGDLVIVEELMLRGVVEIHGLPGNADVELDAGVASVIVADDVTPGPTCTAAEVAACEDDPGGAWGPDCPCREYGRLRIRAISSSDITVDLPPDLWSTASLENAQPGMSRDDDHCTATVDDEVFGTVDVLAYDDSFPWKGLYQLNHPSDAALVGGGFGVRLESAGCSPVQFVEEIDCPGPAQMVTERRGDLRVCSGCLTDR